jgi:REP element-mobilizing transposase RayT
MARPLRIEYDGAVYHVTSRGNNKKPVFFNDEDREAFLIVLGNINQRYNWICHAYCLMNNHYHIVIETPDGNLSKGMRQLNGEYTQIINKRHGRVGHLFQGRYKAILIQKESHLLEVCRYVVLNPVRANLATNVTGWKWSSYLGTAGYEKPRSCLTINWILGQFGARAGIARQRYKEFIKSGVETGSVWNGIKGQILLGREEFTDMFLQYIRDKEEIKEIPRYQRYINRPSLDKLFKDKGIKDKKGRDNIIIEAVEKYGYSQKEVADYVGIHYSAISQMMRRKYKLSRLKT